MNKAALDQAKLELDLAGASLAGAAEVWAKQDGVPEWIKRSALSYVAEWNSATRKVLAAIEAEEDK
jgi:hypothetical protein